MEEDKVNEAEEKKEITKESSKKGKLKSNFIGSVKDHKIVEKVKGNPWIVATFALIIVSAFLLVSDYNLTGNAISSDDAGNLFLSYLDEAGADLNDIEITSITEKSGLYEIYFDYQGTAYSYPYYVSADGSLIGLMSELSEEESSSSSTELVQSDEPVVELFVMAYCPYGTQAEKGIIPAIEALGDTVDFRIRYVYYAMHGEKEVTENLREYCIQEIASTEEFLDYMTCFLEGDGIESDSGYITSGNDVNTCLAEAGIDTTTLEICMSETDEEYSVTESLEDESTWLSGYYPLFNVDLDLNEEYGISGSPVLVINGVQVSSSRDAQSYLETICSAFTDESKPDVCDTVELSSETPSVYFGWDSTGSSTTASCS